MESILLFRQRVPGHSAQWIRQEESTNTTERNRKSRETHEKISFRKNKEMKTRTWKEIKDEVYGMKGTVRRDELERASASFKMGWMLRKAREEKQLTQETLANKVNKKRSFISRIENDGSNMTLKTLYEIVEIGLGGSVHIQIKL